MKRLPRMQPNGRGKAREIVGPVEGPNGSARMAYARARLRAQDEARSAALDADPRTRIPDPDERLT